MKLGKNKRAEEKYMSLWWFFSWIVIAAGIVIGVMAFNSKDVDVREVEAEILSEKLVNCLLDNGNINQDFLENNFDIEICDLDLEVLRDSGYFYIEISSGEVKYEVGEVSFREDCYISEEMKKAEYFPKCIEKKIKGMNSENKMIEVKILTASNQQGGIENEK